MFDVGGVKEAEPGTVPTAVAFGPFRYDPVQRVVSDSHGPLRLGSRAVHLLAVLLEQPGRLFSRDELVARVWPHTVVEETSLRVHISALRKALGDGVDGARYIANVPGRGYVFVGETGAWRPGSGLPPGNVSPSTLPEPDARAGSPLLPPRLTRPIGREHAIAQLAELLARERLVSIIGAGGMGKTTVALAVADTLAGRYADGTHLVDFSHLSDPALVAAELGRTQGLIVPSNDATAVLESALRHKRLLFVLDNCEHVIDAVATLVHRLLRACPGLYFLSTSREPLDIEAEWVFKLPPLALPLPDEYLDLRDLLAYPAIQLFTERAQASCDSFRLTDSLAPAVRQLCGFLDGIPLAIELAAARVDSLGVHELLQRLESAFELLTRGRRTALSRHRTLQAVMDWSYDLLSDSERLVLQRLSVFRGAFDLDGAVAVAACAGLDAARVIDDVLSLSAKSLIVLETADDLRVHRLLYITRLYAEKRLAGSNDAATVHRRHATFIIDGLQRAREAGAGMSHYHWSPALGSSFADVRAAIDWALIAENDLPLGIQLTAFAKRIFCDVGLVQEYLTYIDAALAKLPRLGADRAALELPLRIAAGFMLGYLPDGCPRYLAAFSRTHELLQTAGSESDRIEALFGMSTTSYGQGDYRRSLACCEEIRTLATGRFEPLSIAISDRISALCLHALGDHDAAEGLAWRVIAFQGARVGRQFLSEVPFGVSMRVQLARIQWLRGEFGTAWATLQEAKDLSRDAHVFARGQVLGTAAIPMALWHGKAQLAAEWNQELQDLAERNDLAYWVAHAEAFKRVLDGEAIVPESAVALTVDGCPPLGDIVATLHDSCPSAATQARVDEGAVGWCAPEVMRLVALDGIDRAPDTATAHLQVALHLAEAQGARFWTLRITLSMLAASPDPADKAHARTTLQQLLSVIDDGSDVPELVAARALMASVR